MEKLCAYLLQHLILDFDGEVSMDIINRLLREDDTPEAGDLRARLFAERGPEDFLVVTADCLREHILYGIDSELIQEQIQLYLEA